jgi:NADP-dependent 3-hydroxy acid dehydrogenase YdfG
MTDKVILITGASSGIGEATARAARAAGHKLVLAARRVDKLAALAEELGEHALTVPCDVTSLTAQQEVVARALERFGRIDVVFANAGIGGVPGGFSAGDSEHWKDMILTNVLGVGLTIQASVAALKQSRGHLLITGSVAGRRTIGGSMYSATKWAVSAIGYGLREELAGTGVRVTLIEPGIVDTPFFDTPKPQGLRADDVARSVMFALSQPPSVDLHELMVLPTQPSKG